MMGLMWGGVLVLGYYCFRKVLSENGDKEL